MPLITPETPVLTEPNTFTVVLWNILLDKTRSCKDPNDPQYVKPQSKRIPAQAETLANLGLSLDAVVILEAEKTAKAHNGKRLARALGFEASFWGEHNTSKRQGEHIGMFGNLVEEVEFFDIGHDKIGIIAMIGETALVGIHHRREIFGPMRTHQSYTVLDRIQDFDKAIVVDDTNDRFNGKSRRLFRDEGFRSAFHVVNKPLPPTYPTQAYRSIMLNPLEQAILKNGISIDDILVRGVGVESVRPFEGDSDHAGLAAVINPNPSLY